MERKFVNLEQKARQIRMDLLTMIHRAKTGHTGGALSCTDILVTLFYRVMRLDPERPAWDERDRFILSKGHSVEGYWCILADLGFFPKEWLETFSRFGSPLIGHPNNKVPGVEMNTGALGHGLPIGVGMALAARMRQASWRTFVLMGDGEQAEGSVWEAAMAASHHKLDNLVGIVDRNRLQISGNTEEVMALDSLEEKWRSFGWAVVTCDGHDVHALTRVLSQTPAEPGRPTLMMANTTKGKGVSYMEGVAKWHHGVPSDQQLQEALDSLSGAEQEGLS
jgi:transketolase